MSPVSEQAGRKVVFWDFDGTLARREGMWSAALAEAVALLGTELGTETVTAEELKPYLKDCFPWHRPDEIVAPSDAASWWRRLTPVLVDAYLAVGVPPEAAVEAAAGVGEQYYRPDAWQLIDGATEALALTREHGYRNVILSNHAPELPRLVAALGLDVDLVITSAMVGAEKPNPRIFAHALQTSGAGPDRWMVGDNPVADIDGAEAVGIRAILADGAYPDSIGMTVLQAARQITGRPGSRAAG